MFILLWNCFFVIALFYFYFWTLVILQFKTLCLLFKCNTFICHLVIVNALNNELFIFFLFIIIHPALITSPYTLGYQSYVIWIGNLPLVTNLMWSESEISVVTQSFSSTYIILHTVYVCNLVVENLSKGRYNIFFLKCISSGAY